MSSCTYSGAAVCRIRQLKERFSCIRLVLKAGLISRMGVSRHNNGWVVRPLLSVIVAYCLAMQLVLAAMFGAMAAQQAIAADGAPVVCFGGAAPDTDDDTGHVRDHLAACVLCACPALGSGDTPAAVLPDLRPALHGVRYLFGSQRTGFARFHSPCMPRGPPAA